MHTNVKCTIIVLYIRDHAVFVQKYHPKTASNSFITAWQYWLGIAKPKKCLQSDPKPFQQVSTEFKFFSI